MIYFKVIDVKVHIGIHNTFIHCSYVFMFEFVCVRVFVSVCMSVFVCVCVGVCVHAYMCVRVCAMHPTTHMFHPRECACMHTRARTFACARAHARMQMCMCVYVCMGVLCRYRCRPPRSMSARQPSAF